MRGDGMLGVSLPLSCSSVCLEAACAVQYSHARTLQAHTILTLQPLLENKAGKQKIPNISIFFLLIRQCTNQRHSPDLYAILFFLICSTSEPSNTMQACSMARRLTEHEALEYCKEDQKRFVAEKPHTRITVS